MSDVQQPIITDAAPTQSTQNLSNLSQVVFAIRPWDHEQEMSQLMVTILGLNLDGVTWGATTTENVGYEIRDLILTAVIDEGRISIDNIIEAFIDLDDIISRVDVRLWNKVQ